ncbi:MAG TPA: FAD-dependent oxidoreductase [Burkholderiales bacterium]|nr:FAD-dependent oxidoreductase [Burkholderiales bacterium]
MTSDSNTTRDHDVAVIGGGLMGSAIAWGLARCGQRVVVLDEGDIAYRASRGNFALVWVHSKGLGLPRYSAWTMHSSNSWAEFARLLEEDTGIDVHFQRPGGFNLSLSERELEARAAMLERLQSQPGMQRFDYEMLDRDAVKKALPHVGPEVAGASYSRYDGHCNSLRLFRALNAGMQQLGVTYLPEHRVERIDYANGAFRLATNKTEIRVPRAVLAAGIDNVRLAPMVGLAVPVRPQRGQLIVTEKTAPFLHYPVQTLRQTDEGGVMMGDSQEEAGADPTVTHAVISVLADRAVRMFPRLAQLNIVRTWAALRVMTKDGFPIYDESPTCPGAFSAACHSGVTLAAAHALALAPQIAAGRLAEDMQPFSARRFDVQALAA